MDFYVWPNWIWPKNDGTKYVLGGCLIFGKLITSRRVRHHHPHLRRRCRLRHHRGRLERKIFRFQLPY